ncbi:MULTISPECIES: MFS transporter [unclassified Pseudomonas]|uniref:MFS transporter n=1 Tax=unclassified Pseudomonas TaxID=196821 RepID=UPI000BA47E85|nr:MULTISPECIES: MFS transporter [unclassified Pseudomonas]
MIRTLPRSVQLQLLATLLNSAGGIVKLFMPLYFLEVYGYDFSTIAWLMAAYGGGCILGAYVGGALSERLDSQWATGISLLLSGVFAVTLALTPPFALLLIVVPLVGIFDGAFRPANLRLVMEGSPQELQARVQGLHRVVFNLGVALAGLLAGTLVGFGYGYVFLFQGLLNLFGSFLLLGYALKHAVGLWQLASIAATQKDTGDFAVGSPWRDGFFLVFILGQLLALGIFDQMYGTFGIFLREHADAGPHWIAYLFSMNALLVVVLQLPVSRWIERHGIVIASRLGILLLGGAFLILNMGSHIIWAVLTMLVITAAELLLTPVWTLSVMNRSQGRQRGKYLGIFSAAWLGHSLYGPGVGAWLYGAYGGFTLWWICGGTGLLVFMLHYSTVSKLWTEPGTSPKEQTSLAN